MRCDLHVHTIHSGMCTVPLMNRICRECYTEPEALYETLKVRGMGLVTVTDHDSIDAIEALRSRPDFFLSEEVTCWTPSGTELHMGVYGIREADHGELQSRRTDLPRLIAYLNERNLFCSVNHVFSSLTGPRADADFTFFERHVHGIETLNGQITAGANRSAAVLAARWGKAIVAGSDAHTKAKLGRTYTEVPDARDAAEFLEGLRRGYGRAYGESGDYWKLTRAVLEIGCCLVREKSWTALLAPLLLAAPLVTLGNLIRELTFNHKWSRRLALSDPARLPADCVTESV